MSRLGMSWYQGLWFLSLAALPSQQTVAYSLPPVLRNKVYAHSFTYCLNLLLHYNRAEQLPQRTFGPQSQKYFLTVPERMHLQIPDLEHGFCPLFQNGCSSPSPHGCIQGNVNIASFSLQGHVLEIAYILLLTFHQSEFKQMVTYSCRRDWEIRSLF